MKNIPDFDAEFSQVIEYIFNSDLAHKTFEKPPFDNYANILRETVTAIDRLADNCHMPEFTNHALPHICSVVKRASEWAVNSGWIQKISSQECGYLLLALVIHDMGMLSQDPTHLPDNEKMISLKGLADISTWVRKTHVTRLDKLYREIISNQFNGNEENLELIIKMASTHSIWPWDKRFDVPNELCEKTNTRKEKILALCAVIAVTDLLDEDANRCDTITLIKHKRGNIDNIAHWIRHALTVRISSVDGNKLTIKFRRLPNLQNDFEIVYRALRNHYRLIKLYNPKLATIDASIEIIDFLPSDGITEYIDDIGNSLGIWQDNIELKYNFKERLLNTFMPEAKCIYYDEETEKHIKEIGLETISLEQDNNIETAEEQLVKMVNDDNVIEILDYLKNKSELAFLDGNMADVRYLCYLGMDIIEKSSSKLDIEEIYWIISYMLVCFRKPMDFRQLDNIYKDESNRYKIVKSNSAYTNLFDLAFKLYKFNVQEKIIEKDIDKCKNINVAKIKNDLPTAILIERISEILFFHDIDAVTEFLDCFINKCKDTHMVIYNILSELHDRIDLQKFIFSDKILLELPENLDDVHLLAYSWKCFFDNDWICLEKCINKLRKQMNSKSQFYISLVGLKNMVSNIIKLQNHGEFNQTKLSDYQKYQKLESEVPFGIYTQEICGEIDRLIIHLNRKPYNSSIERFELLRYIMHIETMAIKYWDLALYLKSKEYMTELCVSYTTYRDENNHYCGISSYGKNCIIYAIKSVNNHVISKELKKEIVGIIEIYDKNDFECIYDYIIHESKKTEWFECADWLEYLGDNIPEGFINDLVEWTIKFDDFTKKVKYKFNINRFNYLETIIENFELTDFQWDKIEPIVANILYNPTVARSCDSLCYSVLRKAPIKRCNNYLKQMAEQCCKLNTNETLPEIIYNACVERKELVEYGISVLTKVAKKLDDSKMTKLIEYLTVGEIDKLDNFDEDDILKHFQNDILSLTPDKSIKGVTFNYYGDKTFFYRNINWSLAKDECIDKIFECFENYVNNTLYDTYDSYLEQVLGIMRCIVLWLSDEYKKRYISIILEMIKNNKKVHTMNSFTDSPAGGFKLKSNIQDFQIYGYLYTICEFCDSMTDNQLIYVTQWCVDIFSDTEDGLLYYFSYFFSYIFLTGKDNVKSLAYTGLMMIKATGKMQTTKTFLFEKALRGIEHIFTKSFHGKEIANHVLESTNNAYLEYIIWCIKSLHTSLDYNIRLRCKELINILINNKNYKKNPDIEEIEQILESDSRKSIRNAK